MKTLFITTMTADCGNHVRAWNSWEEPASHLTYNHTGICNDGYLVEEDRKIAPEIIFYIGACAATGNPRPGAFRDLKEIAPLVNLCSDAADRPWHGVLREYGRRGCFSLQVSIDGANNAPVDFVTLTPVDPVPFSRDVDRDIRCGFSGTVGRWNERSEIVRALAWFGGLTVRSRGGDYTEHAAFMKRCRMVLNLSRTGSGHTDHIKGRVLEAGWAGCCLLESQGSPIAEWFPKGCWVEYKDPLEAAEIIASLDDKTIRETASNLASEVRSRFAPRMIYSEILRRVADPVEKAA